MVNRIIFLLLLATVTHAQTLKPVWSDWTTGRLYTITNSAVTTNEITPLVVTDLHIGGDVELKGYAATNIVNEVAAPISSNSLVSEAGIKAYVDQQSVSNKINSARFVMQDPEGYGFAIGGNWVGIRQTQNQDQYTVSQIVVPPDVDTNQSMSIAWSWCNYDGAQAGTTFVWQVDMWVFKDGDLASKSPDYTQAFTNYANSSADLSVTTRSHSVGTLGAVPSADSYFLYLRHLGKEDKAFGINRNISVGFSAELSYTSKGF